MATTYLSAVEAFGHVPLGRACRFSALLKEIRLEAAPEPAVEPESPVSVLSAVTLEEQGATGSGPLIDAVDVFERTVMPLHLAIVEQGRYADVAAVICVARDADGVLRDLTPDEATSDHLPADVYSAAFPLFIEASARLTMAHFNTPSATA